MTNFLRGGTTPGVNAGGVSVATVTVQAGTVATDYGLFWFGNDNSVGGGTWSCSRAGVTITTLQSPIRDNNVFAGIALIKGVVANDTVSFTPSTGNGANYKVHHAYFDDVLYLGGRGFRNGVTGTTVVAPNTVVPPGKVFALNITRTSTAGTTLSSTANANSARTQRYISYVPTSSPNMNTSIQELTIAGTATGTTTFTDSQASGNGMAWHLYGPAAARANFFPAFG